MSYRTGHSLGSSAIKVKELLLEVQAQAGKAFDELDANDDDVTLEAAQAMAAAWDAIAQANNLIKLIVTLNMQALTGNDRWPHR